MLEEKSTIDQIEIKPANGSIQVRIKNAVLKDGEELSFTFHRFVIDNMDENTLSLVNQLVAVVEAHRGK